MNYLVLDVGGSAIKYGLMTKDGEFLEKSDVPVPSGKTATFEEFREVIGQLYDKYKDQINGIAMSMPGQLDSDIGYAFTGGALHYNFKRNIVEDLQVRCPVPIAIENDGKCAALGELFKGNLVGCKDGVVLVLGTGIGGGIIIDGKLHKGKHFFAGEYSGVMVTNDCRTPEEWMKAAFAVQNGVWGLLAPIAMSKQIPMNEINGKVAFELINGGDPEAVAIFDEFCRRMAVQLYNIQNTIDPERICIGGGISAQPILLEGIKKAVQNHADYMEANYDTPTYVIPEVVLCKAGNDANLIGALYSYLVKYE